ncbi:hypothetical protein NEDG_00194 [Nematocida displodere]|uniref:RING-type domain-containing protein n=1 Tax=Nematocida displodere TaxID=1805483 RepID=A0A177EL62_9MICR|nr:hypothetical protein NEDG_00194 [Nematocida displodere]
MLANCTVLKKMLVLLMTASMCVIPAAGACKQPPEVINDNMVHLVPTLTFFEASGYHLVTRIIDNHVYIVKNQNKSIEILLGRYSLIAIPNEIAAGIRFRHLNIRQTVEPAQNLRQPVDLVLEKLLRVLGTSQITSLVFTGIEIPIHEPIQTNQNTESLASASESTSSLSTTTTANTPNTPTKISTNHLWLTGMAINSMKWIFSHIDVSDCDLSLTIDEAWRVRALRFLNTFNPRNLINLTIRGARNLINMDCVIFTEKKVLNWLTLWEVDFVLETSEKTTRALAETRWPALTVSLTLWKTISNATDRPIVIERLTLAVLDMDDLKNCSSPPTPMKASVKTFTICLFAPNADQDSKKTLTRLFGWMAKHLTGINTISIACQNNHILPSRAGHQYLCLDPFFPDVQTINCTLGLSHYTRLYSTKSILWIGTDAYSTWALGKLNKEMSKNYKMKVVGVYIDQPMPFLPNIYTKLNPICMLCATPLHILANNTTTIPSYVGIVCEKGHMGCYPCLTKLILAKKRAKEPVTCCCGSHEIVTNGGSGVIRLGDRGAPHFVFSLTGPHTHRPL